MSISDVVACHRPEENPEETQMVALPPGVAVIYGVNEELPLRYSSGFWSRLIIAYPDMESQSVSARVIFKAKGQISNISPSPNGSCVAFTFKSDRFKPIEGDGEDGGRNPLWLLSLGDGNITDVSAQDPLAQNVSSPPSFSPDGKLLVFGAEDDTTLKQRRLFIYDIETGRLTAPLTLDQMTLINKAPHFLPGGHEVAFGVKPLEGRSNTQGLKRQLKAYNLIDGTHRIIAEFDKEARFGVPIPGPNGEYIYFDIVKPIWNNHREVHRVPIEGGEPEVVFREDFVLYIGDFIPGEGKTILSYHIHEYNQAYVCVGDLETGKTEMLTREDEDIELFTNTGLKLLSPDGKWIITKYHDLTYDYYDVLVMDTTGENRINISNTALFDERLATWIVIPEGIEIPEGGYGIE